MNEAGCTATTISLPHCGITLRVELPSVATSSSSDEKKKLRHARQDNEKSNPILSTATKKLKMDLPVSSTDTTCIKTGSLDGSKEEATSTATTTTVVCCNRHAAKNVQLWIGHLIGLYHEYVYDMTDNNSTTTFTNNNNDDDPSKTQQHQRHDDDLCDLILEIISCNACQALTLQPPTKAVTAPLLTPGSGSSSLMEGIMNRLSHAISLRTKPLEELTISGLTLSLSFTIALSRALKQNRILGLVLQDNAFGGGGTFSWVYGSVEFAVDILAAGLEKATCLKTFRLLTNNNAMLSDRHVAKIIQKGFTNHPSLSTLEINYPFWHMSTLKVIFNNLTNLHVNENGTSSLPPLQEIVLNRQQQSLGKYRRRQQQQATTLDIAAVLSSSISMPSLELLSLCESALDNVDFEHLIQTQPRLFPRLKELDLSGNLISSLSVRNNHQDDTVHSSLRILNLARNPISLTKQRQQDLAVVFDDDSANGMATRIAWKEQQGHLKGLLETHPFLETILLGSKGGDVFSKEFALYTPACQHLMDLNSIGGRLLLLPSTQEEMLVPLAAWPIVLAKTRNNSIKVLDRRRAANAIYHLLRDHLHHGPSIFG